MLRHMKALRLGVAVVIAAGLVACGEQSGPVDAGGGDASSGSDAGGVDAASSPLDAGAQDAGGGATDAGVMAPRMIAATYLGDPGSTNATANQSARNALWSRFPMRRSFSQSASRPLQLPRAGTSMSGLGTMTPT